MKKNASYIVLYLILVVSALMAQPKQKAGISADETIQYLNKKFVGAIEIKNDRGDMIVDYFNKGKKIRRDVVAFEQLDPKSIAYLQDEKSFIIRCIADDCINRHIEFPKTHNYYARINFPYNGDSLSMKGIPKAFLHLLMLFQDPQYKSNTPFEK